MGRSVLLGPAEDPQPSGLVKAVADFKKILPMDAAQAVKKTRGIVAEDMEQKEAEDLLFRLTECGLSDSIVPSESVLALPPAAPRKDIQVPPERLHLIAAACYKVVSSKTVKTKEGPSGAEKVAKIGILLATGLPLPMGRSKEVEKKQETTELACVLELFLKDPPERFTVEVPTFDFSFLKERMLYNVFGNFKIIVEDLVRMAPAALRSKGTRILLEGRPVATMGYESAADLERECRWLLTVGAPPQ